MDKKDINGIVALAVVTVFAFGIIGGAKLLRGAEDTKQPASDAGELNEVVSLDVSGATGIEGASAYKEGEEVSSYEVISVVKGYGGDIKMRVLFDQAASKVTEVEILEHAETEGLGSKITETTFLAQFQDKVAPFLLNGVEDTKVEEMSQETWKDGTYEIEGTEYDGFTDNFQMTVENGAIIEAVWDSINTEGISKRTLVEKGEYIMTESGLTWTEQADALANMLLEKQTLGFLTTDDAGKTDAVAGVSINVYGFRGVVQEAFAQASGNKESITESVQAEDGIDTITGATVSSKAVLQGVNQAAEFLRTTTLQ